MLQTMNAAPCRARRGQLRCHASARPSSTPTSRRAAVVGGLTFLLLAPRPAQTEEVATADAPTEASLHLSGQV